MYLPGVGALCGGSWDVSSALLIRVVCVDGDKGKFGVRFLNHGC